jgi:hypothetical protein
MLRLLMPRRPLMPKTVLSLTVEPSRSTTLAISPHQEVNSELPEVELMPVLQEVETLLIQPLFSLEILASRPPRLVLRTSSHHAEKLRKSESQWEMMEGQRVSLILSSIPMPLPRLQLNLMVKSSMEEPLDLISLKNPVVAPEEAAEADSEVDVEIVVEAVEVLVAAEAVASVAVAEDSVEETEVAAEEASVEEEVASEVVEIESHTQLRFDELKTN